jgi:hypothetical protein
VLHVGAPLGSRLLDPDVVRGLLQPAAPASNLVSVGGSCSLLLPTSDASAARNTQQADALMLLHAAVLAMARAGRSGRCLAEVCDAVLQSGLRAAAEQVLVRDCRSAEQLQLLPGQDALEAQDVMVSTALVLIASSSPASVCARACVFDPWRCWDGNLARCDMAL